MLDLFDRKVRLFESAQDEEDLWVECVVTDAGEMRITQVSDGPLTTWCFEESPHRIEVLVSQTGSQILARHFKVKGLNALLAALRMEFTGYDCLQRLRLLMRSLNIPYKVHENATLR